MLAAILWVAASALAAPRTAGPLRGGDGFHVSMPAADEEVFRWDAGLPWNPTESDIRLESVDLINVRGLEVLGIVLSYPTQANGVCVSAGDDKGFPPAGKITDRIEGVVLPRAADRTCTNYPTIVVGLRLLASTPKGEIEAVRVRYEYVGVVYELVLPSSVDLHRP